MGSVWPEIEAGFNKRILFGSGAFRLLMAVSFKEVLFESVDSLVDVVGGSRLTASAPSSVAAWVSADMKLRFK